MNANYAFQWIDDLLQTQLHRDHPTGDQSILVSWMSVSTACVSNDRNPYQHWLSVRLLQNWLSVCLLQKSVPDLSAVESSAA
jgi:hypothetical protein